MASLRAGAGPPGQQLTPSEQQIAKEFSMITPELMGAAKLEAGFGERDATDLSFDEKARSPSFRFSFGYLES